MKGPYGTAISSGPAGNSHADGAWGAGLHVEEKNKGGRGESGQDYFKE